MELKLVRNVFLQDRTISDLYVNGELFCQILEDVDRKLENVMSLDTIKSIKVFGKTAIPYGKYVVVISYSNRFKKYLPELLQVPGYAGIRIHPGNKPEDTEGCLLPGVRNNDIVVDSRKTFSKLYKILEKVNKKEKITIEISQG